MSHPLLYSGHSPTQGECLTHCYVQVTHQPRVNIVKYTSLSPSQGERLIYCYIQVTHQPRLCILHLTLSFVAGGGDWRSELRQNQCIGNDCTGSYLPQVKPSLITIDVQTFSVGMIVLVCISPGKTCFSYHPCPGFSVGMSM